MNSPRPIVWYKHGLGVVLFCIIVGYLFTHVDAVSSFNQQWIDRDVRGNGLTGALYFLGFGALGTAAGAPRQVLAFLGGYAFGVAAGLILATLATLGGCVLAFYFSKLLIRPIVRKSSTLNRSV